MSALPKLKRSEGYKLCLLMGNDRCACQERETAPCEALKMHLLGGGGDAERAHANWVEMQRRRK